MDDQTSVSVTDIAILKQAIEIASTRGAFRAEEMSSIGGSYDKVARWLDAVMTQEQTNSEGETDA